MRLNIWLDLKNFDRLKTLIGSLYSGKELTANTAFCLFEPGADGLSPDSFPAEPSVFFGSRVGCLYPTCISSRRDPKGGGDPDLRADFIRKRRKADLGEEWVDPKLIERIIWERKHGADGKGLANIMRDLAARFPMVDSAGETLPVLPLMPNLRQAINFGATDCRAVVAIVVPADGGQPMLDHMAHLLFEEGIAGRTHTVRMTPEQWGEAKRDGLVEGGGQTGGIMFMHPDPFGRNAEVFGEIPVGADLAQIRSGLTSGLAEFLEKWRKLDYTKHLKEGVARSITWREWDPVSKSMKDLPPAGDKPPGDVDE